MGELAQKSKQSNSQNPSITFAKSSSYMFGKVLNGTKYLRMDQVKFMEDSL